MATRRDVEMSRRREEGAWWWKVEEMKSGEIMSLEI